MTWLYRFAIHRPWATLLLGLLVIGAAAPGVLRLRLRTDGHALIPQQAPEVRVDREIRERFGLRDPLVVLIRTEHPEGIYNTATLGHVTRLTDAFLDLPEVRPADVFSLHTEYSHRVIPGSLKARPLLEPLPDSRETLDRLRDDLRTYGLYDGTLIAKDEQATAILIGVPDGRDRSAFIRRIQEIVAGTDTNDDIDLLGAPVAEGLLGTHILEDLGVPKAVLGNDAIALIERDTSFDENASLFYRLRLAIAHHVGLVPVAIGVMILVFAISFRRPAAALLPMMEVGACLVFVFGWMGWFGAPIYLTVAVMPVILTAIGVADEIHIFKAYLREHAAHPEADRRAIVLATMDTIHRPVAKTSITTAIGFCSFALSPLTPVSVFGIFTAAGTLFCLLWSLTMIPAMLVLLPARLIVPDRLRTMPEGEPSIFERWAGGVQRKRSVILLLLIAVLGAVPFGIARIRVQDSWIDGFSPESAFARHMHFFNDQFLGSHLLQIEMHTHAERAAGRLSADKLNMLEFTLPPDLVKDTSWLPGSAIRMTYHGDRPADFRGPVAEEWIGRIDQATLEKDHLLLKVTAKGSIAQMVLKLRPTDEVDFEILEQPLKRPDVLRQLSDFEAFLKKREQDRVGGVIGIARLLRVANLMARSLRHGSRRLPDDIERAEWLWNQYTRIRGEDRFRQTVSGDFERGLTTVYLKEANFRDTQRLIDAVHAYEREHFQPEGISLRFAGDVAVSQAMIAAIVRTQVRSLLFSLIGIFAVASILNRSVRYGFLCVVPCLVAVAISFACMGLLGLPLGVATSMFAGMTLGVGVDYGIHLTDRYRRARGAGSNRHEATTHATREVGPAITIDGLAVTLGFGILILSQVPANQRLGMLIAISILSCLLSTLLILPALLGSRRVPASPDAALLEARSPEDDVPRIAS